jgi:hypothetical protein
MYGARKSRMCDMYYIISKETGYQALSQFKLQLSSSWLRLVYQCPVPLTNLAAGGALVQLARMQARSAVRFMTSSKFLERVSS